MKDPDKVKFLIALLKAQATTDFELHRVEVLEKDLFDPPKIEVIDEKYQTFNGDTFYKNKRGHYVHGDFLHRCVWEYHHGTIPENYHIHHKDFDKDNNNIENLQLLTEIEHHQLHRELTKKIFVCIVCGKEYVAVSMNGNNKFCSSTCENIDKNKRQKTERVCEYCGEIFKTNKYRPGKCCSRSCSVKLSWQKRIQAGFKSEKMEIRTCEFCGKNFEARKDKPQKCCSKSCGAKLRCQKEKRRNITTN